MDRGTYIAASAGLAQFRKLEIVNNNLANIDTVGFKREVLEGKAQSFDDTLASAISKQDPYAQGDQARTPAIINVESSTDFSQGPVQNTGNGLDAALRNANDFFVINTPDGVQYTRAGNFTINSEGTLVTQDGFEVQSDGGTIQVTGTDVKIQSDGSVVAGGAVQGNLAVVRFDDTKGLRRAGGNRFVVAGNGAQPEQVAAQVVPQALEMSNVGAVTSVVDLISAQRAFQMYTKAADSIDTINQVSINQIGRRT